MTMRNSQSKKIELRPPIHEEKYRVIYGDTDAAGVMYYANYLRLFEIGRNEYMRNILMLPYHEIEKGDILFPVVELSVRYIYPVKYDDLVTIRTCIDEVTKKTITFNYHIVSSENKVITLASTMHVAINRNQKVTRIPQEILSKFEGILIK